MGCVLENVYRVLHLRPFWLTSRITRGRTRLKPSLQPKSSRAARRVHAVLDGPCPSSFRSWSYMASTEPQYRFVYDGDESSECFGQMSLSAISSTLPAGSWK